MTKKKEKDELALTRRAYSDGHFAALFRKSEDSMPEYNDRHLIQAWQEGYRKTVETVAYHLKALHTRTPSSHWINNLSN